MVGQGNAPYGYRYSRDTLVIDENEAQVVRMIFDWYANGELNLVGIARRLTKLGIPTPSQSKGLTRRRAFHGYWADSTVNYILGSETYCGIYRYGKEATQPGKRGRRPQDEQIIIPVPAIVTRETWERAQARRTRNSRNARRRMKREYLLRGLIFCGCGRHMVGSKEKYFCTRRYKSNGGGEPCTEPLVRGEIIESLTWDYIMKLVKDSQQFEEKLRQAQAKEAATMQPRQKELEHVIALLEDTEKEAEVIARETLKAKGIIAAKLEQQGDEVNRRYQALTARKMELQDALALELTDSTINNLLQFRETVALGLDNPSFEDRRRWLEILETAVTVTDQKAVIRCRLSSESFALDLGEPMGQGLHIDISDSIYLGKKGYQQSPPGML